MSRAAADSGAFERAAPPRLSVVIPTYNGKHLLERCLASLERWLPPNLPAEVIVADDASTDGTVEWLLGEHPWVRVVELEQNGGFCAAANAGIEAAEGHVIQLLNNDAEVTAGWAEAGLHAFDDPRIGAVAPLVLVRGEPSKVDSAGDGYHCFGLPYKRGRNQSAAKWSARSRGPVFGASASSAFYRADVLKQLDGFDARFGSYYEDVELAFRLRRLGYTCVYEPTCVILHDVSATYDHARPELQRRMARNAELIFWTRQPAVRLAVGLLPHLALTLAQIAHRAMGRRLRPYLLGKLDALRLLASGQFRRGAVPRSGTAAIPQPHTPPAHRGIARRP